MSDAATTEYLMKITKPECFGPGKWDDMHVLGLNAKTYAKKIAFIQYVELIFDNIRCVTCRSDALGYLSSHPITDYFDIIVDGEDVGIFYWTVDCHNWVNRKLGKPEIPTALAYDFYAYPEKYSCTEGCGEDKPMPPKKPVMTGFAAF
jgi:hypothetical protein